MKRSIIAFLTIFALMATFSQVLFSQEETYYSYGEISSASGDIVAIEEVSYDDETGEEITEMVEFDISPDVVFEGFESVADISPGDAVEIDYVVKGGKKVAVYVYRIITE